MHARRRGIECSEGGGTAYGGGKQERDPTGGTATLTSGRQRPSPGAAGSWDRIGFTNETRSPGSLHPVPLTAAPLAAPNAQVTPAHRTEPFPRRFVSHDRSASARALPHRPRTGHRRVCSRRCRCALDESLDESGASALPQHWGDLAVFLRGVWDLPEGRPGQRRTAAAPTFSAGTPERRPATAQAAPAPPAATTRAWRTCASHASGSCFRRHPVLFGVQFLGVIYESDQLLGSIQALQDGPEVHGIVVRRAILTPSIKPLQ